MAANASEDRVRADIRPPDFRKAVVMIRTTIVQKKAKISSINGEVGDAWAKIEGMKVNKQAGKIFGKLDAAEPADRADIMRSLNGLIDAAGWPPTESDLVDGAEGKVVQMRVGGAAEEPGEEEEDRQEDEEPEPSRRARRSPPGLAALESVRDRMGDGLVQQPAA